MNMNDSLMESHFTDLLDDDKSNKKFSELQKEMKSNCFEEFSLPETQIVNFSSKNGYIKFLSFYIRILHRTFYYLISPHFCLLFHSILRAIFRAIIHRRKRYRVLCHVTFFMSSTSFETWVW
jgi:hypothetical protein